MKNDNTLKPLKKNWLANALVNEKWSSFTVPAVTIILALFVSSLLLVVLGKNPFVGFLSLLQGSGIIPKASYGGGKGPITDIFDFLNILAPMILATLAFLVAYRCGLFNIGIAGQMLLGGFLAIAVIGYADVSPWIAKPVALLVGVLVGGAIGAFSGFLKYKFNVHEVVTTVMFSHIINFGCAFFLNTYFADPVSRSMRTVSSAARLTLTGVPILGYKCNVPLGLIIAIAAVFIVKFIFEKTVFGFELAAVGKNIRCARYTGVNVGAKMIYAMAFSGILAGMAGVCYYCGLYNTINPKALPDMGYTAIAVALLGNCSPIGSIFAGILITIFTYGANYMSSTLNISKEIASLITGILLVFSACSGYFVYLANRRVQKEHEAELEEQKRKELFDDGKEQEA